MLMGHQEPVYTEVENRMMTAIAAIQVQMSGFQKESSLHNEAIVSRLDKLNGSVARNTLHIGELQIEVAERRNACPVVEKLEETTTAQIAALTNAVGTLRTDLDERAGEDRRSSEWMKYLQPLFFGFLGVLLVLALLHGKELLTTSNRIVP